MLICGIGVVPVVPSITVGDIPFCSDALPVSRTMQVIGLKDVYAAGDCCQVQLNNECISHTDEHTWLQMKLWSQVCYLLMSNSTL